jgi:hypothetical protein
MVEVVGPVRYHYGLLFLSKVFALLTFVRVIFFGFIFSMFMMVFSFKAQLRQAAVKLRQLEKGLV